MRYMIKIPIQKHSSAIGWIKKLVLRFGYGNQSCQTMPSQNHRSLCDATISPSSIRAARSIKYPEKPFLKDAQKTMVFAKKYSAQNSILFEQKISFGDPGRIIVRFVKDKKFDIIVIGARGRGALKEIFFRSVSN